MGAALASHPYARSLSLPQPASSGVPHAHNHHHHSFSSPFDIQRSVSISNQDYYLQYGAYRGAGSPYGRPLLPLTTTTTPPPAPRVQGLTAFYKERVEFAEEHRAHHPPQATNGSFRIGMVGGEEAAVEEAAAQKRVAVSSAAPELTKILPRAQQGQPAGVAAVDEDYDC